MTSRNIKPQTAQKRVLENQTGTSDAEDVAQGAPELKGARDDGLLGLGGGGQDGHEGAGELEALADGGGHETGQMGPEGPLALQGEQDGAQQEENGAALQGPLQVPGARDEDAR